MALTKVTPSMTEVETTSEKTWYVSTTGSDTTGDGTSGNPFATIQKAWDSIPPLVKHYQTIQLADGTYSTNYIDAADQPRPAILWGYGKTTTIRSTSTGSDIDAAIRITGNNTDATAVKIKCTSDYTYGVYINKGNVALTHMTIEGDGSNTTDALLVAHRTDTYVHTKTLILDGVAKANTTIGAYAESGAQLELTDTSVDQCGIGIEVLTGGDQVTFSAGSTYDSITNCNTGVLAKFGSVYIYRGLATGSMISNCSTYGINAISGGSVEIRGSGSSNRPLIESGILMEAGTNLNAVLCNIDAITQLTSATVKFDNVNYQQKVILRGSTMWHAGSTSYISPSTNNTDTDPIVSLFGSSIYYTGTNNIVGSSGGYTSRSPEELVFTADSQIVSVVDYVDVYYINGAGGNRLTCEINSTDVEDGRVIFLTGDTWSVQFNGSGTHMQFDTNFSIGTSTGEYSGATFVMYSGKWHLVSLGEVRT